MAQRIYVGSFFLSYPNDFQAKFVLTDRVRFKHSSYGLELPMNANLELVEILYGG